MASISASAMRWVPPRRAYTRCENMHSSSVILHALHARSYARANRGNKREIYSVPCGSRQYSSSSSSRFLSFLINAVRRAGATYAGRPHFSTRDTSLCLSLQAPCLSLAIIKRAWRERAEGRRVVLNQPQTRCKPRCTNRVTRRQCVRRWAAIINRAHLNIDVILKKKSPARRLRRVGDGRERVDGSRATLHSLPTEHTYYSTRESCSETKQGSESAR